VQIMQIQYCEIIQSILVTFSTDIHEIWIMAVKHFPTKLIS